MTRVARFVVDVPDDDSRIVLKLSDNVKEVSFVQREQLRIIIFS